MLPHVYRIPVYALVSAYPCDCATCAFIKLWSGLHRMSAARMSCAAGGRIFRNMFHEASFPSWSRSAHLFARSLLIVDSRPVFITCAVCSAIAPKTDESDHSAPPPYTVCASAADWWGVHWLLRCPLGDPVFVVLIVPTTCMEPSYTSPCLSRMYLRNEYILTSLLSLLDMINRMGVNGQRDLIPRSEGGYTYGRELTEDMVRKHIRA